MWKAAVLLLIGAALEIAAAIIGSPLLGIIALLAIPFAATMLAVLHSGAKGLALAPLSAVLYFFSTLYSLRFLMPRGIGLGILILIPLAVYGIPLLTLIVSLIGGIVGFVARAIGRRKASR